MEQETLRELSQEEICNVSGGYWDWSDIAGSLGHNVGSAAGWFYNNVMIGDPGAAYGHP